MMSSLGDELGCTKDASGIMTRNPGVANMMNWCNIVSGVKM